MNTQPPTKEFPLKSTCNMCGTGLTSMSCLIAHVRNMHPDNPGGYRCFLGSSGADSGGKSRACGKKCRDKARFFSHLREAHAPSQCPQCHERFFNVSALIKHMELRHEDSDPEGVDITTTRRQCGTSASQQVGSQDVVCKV